MRDQKEGMDHDLGGRHRSGFGSWWFVLAEKRRLEETKREVRAYAALGAETKLLAAPIRIAGQRGYFLEEGLNVQIVGLILERPFWNRC
jgi:hypothetical protein